VPIESNLRPLIERLNAERQRSSRGTDRVLWLPDDEDRAVKLREHLLLVGVKRAELFMRDAQRKNITFHDLQATGITWMAVVRGDDPLRIKQRAGHKSFSTTEGYIREAENLSVGFGDPFPILPAELTGGFGASFGVLASSTLASARNHLPKLWSKGGSNTLVEGEGSGVQAVDIAVENGVDGGAASSSASELATGEDDSRPSTPNPADVQVVDAVEVGLANALLEAARAHRWDIVAQLARELEVRRLAAAEKALA